MEEEIQITFNEDDFKQIIESGDVENEDKNDLSEQ